MANKTESMEVSIETAIFPEFEISIKNGEFLLETIVRESYADDKYAFTNKIINKSVCNTEEEKFKEIQNFIFVCYCYKNDIRLTRGIHSNYIIERCNDPYQFEVSLTETKRLQKVAYNKSLEGCDLQSCEIISALNHAIATNTLVEEVADLTFGKYFEGTDIIKEHNKDYGAAKRIYKNDK